MRIEEETALRQKLLELCKNAVEFWGISVCGETSPDSTKSWHIQQNGKDMYFTLEEAVKYLESLRKR